MNKTIAKDQLLIVRGAKALGLTGRGRVMKSPIEQTIDFIAPNKYKGIVLEHVSGPLKGAKVQFVCAIARKAKLNKSTCNCPALAYPHNKGQGDCNES